MASYYKVTSDLFISYKTQNIYTPSCIVQKLNSKYAAMLSFIPLNDDGKDLDSIEGTGEYLFILDRSGSMETNNRIVLAKQAIIFFLKSLPVTSKFNIISFGSDAEKLFVNSQPSTSEMVTSALKSINEFSANMGGTNIYKALEIIFQEPANNAYPRTLFLLTDGGEGNPQYSLSLIQNNISECRIHAFGIQSNKNEADFITKAAKFGKGCSFFINNPEEISKKIILALSKSIMPCMNK